MNQFDDRWNNIVPLKGFRKDMKFPAIAEVRAYWEALRSGRSAPARSEVDPRGIENALEYAFILERIAPKVARFRLAGMHLNDLMGMEVRGMPLTSFFTPGLRDDVAAVVDSVFAGPQIVDMSLAAEVAIGRPALNARLLILPLRSDLGDMNRALGCLVSEGPIGRAPRRFDVSGVKNEAITVTAQDDVLRGAVQAQRQLSELRNGFAEAQTSFRADQSKSVRSRGHLRLVVTDE